MSHCVVNVICELWKMIKEKVNLNHLALLWKGKKSHLTVLYEAQSVVC